MLSICNALSHNFTVKSLAFFNKSHNESPNDAKRTASEQASRRDMKFLTRYATKVIRTLVIFEYKVLSFSLTVTLDQFENIC